MLRKIGLAIVAVCFGSAAYATDYAIFYPGDGRPSELRQGSEPKPGEDCPPNSKVKIFAPLPDENGKPDTDYRNYILTASGLKRVIETPVVDAKPAPKTDAFFEALAASGEFTDEEFGQALRCRYITDVQKRDAKILEYAISLPEAKRNLLIQFAQQNNIELPLPQN